MTILSTAEADAAYNAKKYEKAFQSYNAVVQQFNISREPTQEEKITLALGIMGLARSRCMILLETLKQTHDMQEGESAVQKFINLVDSVCDRANLIELKHKLIPEKEAIYGQLRTSHWDEASHFFGLASRKAASSLTKQRYETVLKHIQAYLDYTEKVTHPCETRKQNDILRAIERQAIVYTRLSRLYRNFLLRSSDKKLPHALGSDMNCQESLLKLAMDYNQKALSHYTTLRFEGNIRDLQMEYLALQRELSEHYFAQEYLEDIHQECVQEDSQTDDSLPPLVTPTSKKRRLEDSCGSLPQEKIGSDGEKSLSEIRHSALDCNFFSFEKREKRMILLAAAASLPG